VLAIGTRKKARTSRVIAATEGGDMPDDEVITPPQRAAVDEAVRAIPGYDKFEIDIEKVMRADLPAHFASVPSVANRSSHSSLGLGVISPWTGQVHQRLLDGLR
jgi:hypothetical protein